MTSLLVRRVEGGFRDRFGTYKVLIDDEEAGRLRRGGSVQIQLQPGQHVVQVAIDWRRSASFEVTGDGEETYAFRCGPRTGSLALVDLFKRGDDTWLFLERDAS